MRRMALVLVAMGWVSAGTASAQEVNGRAALQASPTAMGGANLKTIEYSSAGWSLRIGQTCGPGEDCPHFEVDIRECGEDRFDCDV